MVLFKYKSSHLIPFLQTTSSFLFPPCVSQSPFSGLQGPPWHSSCHLSHIIPSCSPYPHLALPLQLHQPLAVLPALLHTLMLEPLLWFFPLPGTHSLRYWQDNLSPPSSLCSSLTLSLSPHEMLQPTICPSLVFPIPRFALLFLFTQHFFPSDTPYTFLLEHAYYLLAIFPC